MPIAITCDRLCITSRKRLFALGFALQIQVGSRRRMPIVCPNYEMTITALISEDPLWLRGLFAPTTECPRARLVPNSGLVKAKGKGNPVTI